MREQLRELIAEMMRGGISLDLAKKEFEKLYLEEVLAANDLTYVHVGHVAHHMKILDERYFPG